MTKIEPKGLLTDAIIHYQLAFNWRCKLVYKAGTSSRRFSQRFHNDFLSDAEATCTDNLVHVPYQFFFFHLLFHQLRNDLKKKNLYCRTSLFLGGLLTAWLGHNVYIINMQKHARRGDWWNIMVTTPHSHWCNSYQDYFYMLEALGTDIFICSLFVSVKQQCPWVVWILDLKKKWPQNI